MEQKTKKFKFLNMSSLGLGFLATISVSSFWHEIEESAFSVDSILISLLFIVAGFLIGRSLAKHLSFCTHDHVDDAKDVWFLVIVVVGSLVHTFFDGSIVHEGFSVSIAEGSILLLAILGHEIIRTTVLYNVLRAMSFPKKIALLSVFGVSVLGIFLGFVFSSFISIGEYEGLGHLVSGALFVAVATDLFYYIKHHGGRIKMGFLIFGSILVFVINFLHIGH
ncbi:MAG: hypothetical protein KA007_00930 [Candidatus Pacebacteria bacterium]|jgi:zinc transporter ZupT|nr:hypothetical protein [Candidatus Paceibacterota bacterium]